MSFLLLADMRQADVHGLYELDIASGDDEWEPPEPVDEELEALLWSGKRYPPSLALARDDVERRFEDRVPTRAEFASAYKAALGHRMSTQPTMPFVLARCVREELGYCTLNEWYWVLRVTSDDRAYWVSDDYHIYQDASDTFELTERQRAHLRNHEAA